MKTELIRIGNSRGVRIPKPLIEQCGLGKTVELRVENDRLIVTAERHPRQGWGEVFRAAGASRGDDLLLDSTRPNEFEHREWKW